MNRYRKGLEHFFFFFKKRNKESEGKENLPKGKAEKTKERKDDDKYKGGEQRKQK